MTSFQSSFQWCGTEPDRFILVRGPTAHVDRLKPDFAGRHSPGWYHKKFPANDTSC
jgi:hypothetical protein